MNNNEIAMIIKKIPFENVLKEWSKLKQLSYDEISNLNGRSRLGCDLIDHYFFKNRLETIGNKGIHFFDFLENITFYKSKKYIQTLLTFCEKNNRYIDSEIKKYYYCYGLCFGRINAFKITNALQLYHKYKPTAILDPFCGFGGRLVAAMIQNINYIGVDLNIDLKPGYNKIREDLGNLSESNVEILFQDALSVDFSNKHYDMVFTSPPYENIEIYKNMEKKTTPEWSQFYTNIFQKLWDHLQKDGIYAININDNIFSKILYPLFGEAHEKIMLKKSSKNNYTEYIYIWKKL
jgi:16S rRNA G966 N2-methylase RsmD